VGHVLLRFANDEMDQHRMAFEANDMPEKVGLVGLEGRLDK